MSAGRNGETVGMIWAQTESGVIGRDGTMPWHVPEDLAYFKRTTAGHPVIMGRRTWESFPARYRPLPGRTNVVITRRRDWASTPEAAGAVVVHSLDEALEAARSAPGAGEIWILGGGQLFAEAADVAGLAAITVLDSAAGGDTFAPVLGPGWTLAASDPAEGWHRSAGGTGYRFTRWTRAGAEPAPS
ncbi:MAG TPA: dihydrofolate reductase [Micrococcaceae bacterium]|jgi:dihydrofolate reductase